MALRPGLRIGAYEVVSSLGAGGMGEVFRARDTRLNRDVAIKALPESLAVDPDRVARFAREAQTLAALNHPHIAQIYNVEEDGSSADGAPGATSSFLVMELVEGEDLAQRIARGPIPVDEAMPIARQIAEALDAAHETGIIHRDLKPANIKVRSDGTVKVLDFGLAKAIDSAAGGGASGQGLINSPTITSPAMTQAGLILGTAAYMSPEQAKGRAIDRRTDVWAFGCVLYEMLTGRRAFDGEDVTDTIAAVVRGEPNWQALPQDSPSQIALLLKRCLEKDRRARIGDIGTVRFLLNEQLGVGAAPSSPPAVADDSRGKSRWWLAAAAIVGLAAGGALAAAGIRALSRPPAPPPSARFTIVPPSSQPLALQGGDHDIAIAPDGSFIVYRSGENARYQLMIRWLNELEARVLPGTTNARAPFVSPDGRWIGFQAGNDLRKVAVAGGVAETVCRTGGAPRGATWTDDDEIVFATGAAGLQRVAASGGDPRPLTTLETSARELHVFPTFVPNTRYLLFTAYTNGDLQSPRIEAVEIDTGKRKTVLRSGMDATYVATGRLIYVNVGGEENRFRGSLRSVRFDATRGEASGDSVAVMDGVSILSSPGGNYAVSRTGHLLFVPSEYGPAAQPPRTLVWVNRKGEERPLAAQPRAYAVARISPDGSRVALDLRDQTNDIWIWDLARETLTPLNRDPAQDLSPLWTPDGKRVIWTSTRGGGNPNLYWQASDGSGAAERLTTAERNQFPTSIGPDGNTLVLFGGSQVGALDIFTLALNDREKTAQPLISTSALDVDGELSPDGRWLAYHSSESGELQVYVRPYPNVQDGRYQISTTGGTRPAWARSGRELFYLDRDGLLTSVTVADAQGTAFSAGTPARILRTRYYAGSTLLGLDLRAYDIAPDGQRFLMIKEGESTQPREVPLPGMVVVLNWGTELIARLPAR